MMNKKRILIIDDDENMRHAILRLLSTVGKYDIEEACDGFAAERQIKEFSPHLIILDIKMPEKDGYEVCYNIRKDAGMDAIKIVAISRLAPGLAGNIGDAIMSALGADCFFQKPFDNDKFKNGIATLLAEV